MGGGIDYGLVIDVVALSLAGVLMMRMVSRLDPRPAKPNDAKRAAVAERLLRGREGPLVLRDHEVEVAADVVSPEDIDVSFEDVGGLSCQARQLQHAILLPVRRPELFAKSRLLRPPKGILLHGPPGTGKTMLARAIAREAQFTFLNLNPARLFSKWYGESNKYAEAYFSLAHKLAPSIIFIDEIDCLFSSTRGQNEHEATSVLKAQFLSLWDGLSTPTSATSAAVIVVAATNRPNAVDPAVLRRLPLSFEVELPGLRAREHVMRLLLKDEPLASGVDLDALARATDGYSGSDLDQLVKTTAMRSLESLLEEEERRSQCRRGGEGAEEEEEPLTLRPLTLEDFLQAQAVVRPTRGRFSGVSHGMGPAGPTPPYDADLYD